MTSRRPRRHINFNGMVVTQTHVNLNPNAMRRPRRGVVNGMNDRNNRPNQPARPPSANNRPRPNRNNPPNFNSIMANIMRQQQRNNPQRRNSQNSSNHPQKFLMGACSNLNFGKTRRVKNVSGKALCTCFAPHYFDEKVTPGKS